MSAICLDEKVEPARRGSGANRDWLRALQKTAHVEDDPRRILAIEFDDVAALRGDAAALISEHESFSFGELAARSNQYARSDQHGGATRRAARPEKTDGSARSSWGLGPRKR